WPAGGSGERLGRWNVGTLERWGGRMTTWEYHKTSSDGELGKLGREGWELVGVVPDSAGGDAILYFKRPALNFRERVTMEQKRHYYGLMVIKLNEEGQNA